MKYFCASVVSSVVCACVQDVARFRGGKGGDAPLGALGGGQPPHQPLPRSQGQPLLCLRLLLSGRSETEMAEIGEMYAT